MSAESANFVTIAPESKHIVTQDAVVVAPYPHGGDIANTGDRLQWVANRLGVHILAADLFAQQTTTLHGEPVHQALEPGEHFRETSLRNADMVREQLKPYDSAAVIGLGQSLAGVAITGMQRYAEAPFDVVQIDDGFNLRPIGEPSLARFMGYQALDAVQQLFAQVRGQDVTGRSLLTHHDWSEYQMDSHKSAMANIRDLSGIMRSSESRDGVEQLAKDPKQRMHVVGFTRGISGTSIQVSSFFADLHDSRRLVETGVVDHKRLRPANPRLKTTMLEGWHSTILHPAVLADNLTKTLRLMTVA